MTNGESRFGGEKILVVPDSVIKRLLGDGNNFFPSNSPSLPEDVISQAFFMDREKAEDDISHRQLIPYVIIRFLPENEFFLFKRLASQGEKRLHNLYSLGAGGHINPHDDMSGNPLLNGLKRELEEELVIPDDYEMKFKGWIHSEIDPVSRVHAGMVFVMDIATRDIYIKEKEKMTGEWAKVDCLENKYDEMEGWSRIVMDNLIREKTTT